MLYKESVLELMSAPCWKQRDGVVRSIVAHALPSQQHGLRLRGPQAPTCLPDFFQRADLLRSCEAVPVQSQVQAKRSKQAIIRLWHEAGKWWSGSGVLQHIAEELANILQRWRGWR